MVILAKYVGALIYECLDIAMHQTLRMMHGWNNALYCIAIALWLVPHAIHIILIMIKFVSVMIASSVIK